MSTLLKLGTGTGSLINHVMSAGSKAVPVVGMGVTLLGWTDRHAGTITEISKDGKRLAIVEDEATRIDKNGMSEQQEYSYAPGKSAARIYTLRKNGAFVLAGDSMKNGSRLLIGTRDAYHDYSF